MKYKHLILSLSLIMLGPLAHAEEIGSVDTVFKMIGPDHKIVVEAFDDPDVKNVTCYVSRAKTGGIKGGLGLAEDTSDAAISCQQVGPIELSDRIKNGKAQGEVACGFPYVYKTLGIGKLIGAPVPGTMTAVWWENQIDQSIVFGIPQVAALAVKEGRYLENMQIEPDILVYNDPASVLRGEDKQLEAAVAEMLKTIDNK